MKKLFNILILLLSIHLTAQNGWLGFNDNTVPLDKQQHIVAGLGTGTIGYTLGYEWSKGKRSTAIWTGIGTTAVLGTIKELTDIPNTGFNRDDLFSTIIGGVISTLATDLIMSKYTYQERQEIRLQKIKERDQARQEHELERMERRNRRRNKT